MSLLCSLVSISFKDVFFFVILQLSTDLPQYGGFRIISNVLGSIIPHNQPSFTSYINPYFPIFSSSEDRMKSPLIINQQG